jgi:arylamine N-acetyltransferase
MDTVDWSSVQAPTHRPLNTIELAAYFSRIRCDLPSLPVAPDATLLKRIVCAHAFSIPFESLDVTLRTPISIAPSAIFDKLVVVRRGGYCLENSFLLLAALQTLGFDVRLRSARVWMRSTEYTPRNPQSPRAHVVLLVRAPGGDGGGEAGDVWLVDVGFGGGSPSTPLPLRDGAEVTAAGDVFRTDAGDAAAGDDDWILWGIRSGEWKRLYSFGHTSWDAPIIHVADFISTNFFVSAAPGYLFCTMRIVSLPLTSGGRITLLNNELRRRHETEREGHIPAMHVEVVPDARAYRAFAAEYFGVELTEDQAIVVFNASAVKP